ncbi:hypothetical protein CR513_06023, partial [Mucuna pruriens]
MPRRFDVKGRGLIARSRGTTCYSSTEDETMREGAPSPVRMRRSIVALSHLISGSSLWTLLVELKTLTLTYRLSVYISGGDDALNCKLFPGTLKDVAILPSRTICNFNDLATLFTSQFATNKTKRLEVNDLFDIKQMKGENLKKYLVRFNNATVRVNNPNQKFFVKAFQKGLHT